MSEETETNPKALTFIVGESGLLITRPFLGEVTLKIKQEKYL